MTPRRRALLTRSVPVLLLVLAAFSQYWLEPLRPGRLEDHGATEIVVSSGADFGPGTLREALFNAARSSSRSRISIRVPRISLANPLPPVAHAAGIVIEGPADRTLIDARLIGSEPVLDLQTPNAVLRNIGIENAAGTAILIRANDFVGRNLTISGADVGLTTTAANSKIRITDCQLLDNRVAIQLGAAAQGAIQHNELMHNSQTALWAVVAASRDPRSTPGVLQIEDNRFLGNRDSIVLGNVPAVVDNNEFQADLHNSITLRAGGAAVRSNRIRGAGNDGIFAEGVNRVSIESNEVGEGPGAAIFLRSVANVMAEHNRIYSNAYGLVMQYGEGNSAVTLADNVIFSQHIDGLLIIGSSPIVQGNQSLRNGAAGIRVLDFIANGVKRTAAPLLRGNTLNGNGLNDVYRGEYRP
jgi:hypothetical protein